jgi:flavoprotein
VKEHEAWSMILKTYLENPNVKSNTTIMGWGFSGAGQNVGVSFTTLKDFENEQRLQMTNANTSMKQWHIVKKAV